MRILTRTIWRAFPELDRFSDEQCERFVKAANARTSAKMMTWLVASIATALVSATALIVPIWLQPKCGNVYVFPALDDIYMHALLTRAWFWAWWMFAGGIAGFITRDVLLRLRVRRILRTRATCVQCRYSLLGLAVPASLIVQCPECGTPTHVDESMGELTVDEEGAARFTPKDVRKPPRIFTTSRMRVIKRVAVVTAIGLPVIVGGSFFCYEWFLRRQAAKALADRLTPEALMELMEQGQPADSDPRSVSVYDIVPRAEREKANADLLLEQKHPVEVIDGRKADWPDMTMIYAPYDPGYKPTEFDLATARRGRWQFELYQSSQLPAILDEMSATTNSRRSYNFLPQDPASTATMQELGQLRNLARYNAARMHVALQNHDSKEWLRAFESTLALSRACSTQPFAIAWMVSDAIESLAMRQLNVLLSSKPNTQMLDAIEQAINRQTRSDFGIWPKGERAIGLDIVAWVFADPDNVRYGRPSKGLYTNAGVTQEMLTDGWRIGTYAENVAEYNKFADRKLAGLSLTAYGRLRQPTVYNGRLILVQKLLANAWDGTSRSDSRQRLNRPVAFTMIALERYKIDNGDYPQVLEELVPGYVAELPLDPWAATATPLSYRRVDPQDDPECRSYLLYTVGGDATDNGGFMKNGERDFGSLNSPDTKLPAVDFVLNTFKW